MPLREGFEKLALILQEQADSELSHSDLHRWLSDAALTVEGGAWVVDVYGDGESGDVVISCNGNEGGTNLKRVPYEIQTLNEKVTAILDMDSAEDVLPHTIYEPEADEADHYASMEAKRDHRLMPLYERFISKAERDAASVDSFAGKGKSFPILKPADVMAAVRSIGRAGTGNLDAGTLKRNIIAKAKAKGWTKYLPKAWQAKASQDDKKESLHAGAEVGNTKLVESAVQFVDAVRLDEAARTDYEVKLIAPGKGSSAYYPFEVLKRDGPKVFTSGTHMYWNHATEAEEAARPEGNLDHLAAVLTTNAYYVESGKQGPGLYARAKVFGDYAEKVAEKAPHIGLSIRASGNVENGKLTEGRPVLKELVYADSADFVTKAGAGGMILTESHRETSDIKTQEGVGMDEAEVTQLKESQKKLAQRLALFEARDYADAEIVKLRLPDAAKQRIRERVVAQAPVSPEGVLDVTAFGTLIENEAKDEAAYLQKLTGGRIVTGMGSAQPPADADPAKVTESFENEMKSLGATLGLSETARKTFVEGRAV